MVNKKFYTAGQSINRVYTWQRMNTELNTAKQTLNSHANNTTLYSQINNYQEILHSKHNQ